MNQQELEALLAQIAPNNDPRRLEFSEATEAVDVPDPDSPSAGAKKKVNVRTMTWVDRGTGQTLKVQVDPTAGTYTKISQGIDPKQQGEPATTPAQVAKDEQGVEMGSEQVTDAQGKTVKITTYRRPDGTEYKRTDSVQAAPKEPQVVAGTLNTTSPNVGIVGPDGQTITWIPNKNYNNPSPQPISIPGNPKTIIWDDGPGKPVRTEKNPAYVKPSKIMPHPSDPTKMVNVTEDDAGNPVILPVDDKTVIKPADLPVLQAQYGQIATGLGALAQDLNSRYARGEITEQQKNTAFTAAHQQAQTQVAEINSILDTSKAIWSGELTQRGQSLNETQSRRGFAQNIFDRAAATGMGIATSAGPGHGKAIAGGVQALMNMGQRYAEGMGGFRESPEVALPPALQQARGIGLPGYGPAPAGAAPGPPGAPPPAPAASPPNAIGAGAIGAVPAPGAPPAPPLGISNTTDAGGVPRVKTPASATNALPMTPQAMIPGQDPRLEAMQQQLQSGLGFGGSPVAAGGGGVYDPSQDIQGMIGDGADPTWAEAVRAAAAEVNQPGYAWQRFTQPASRFG